MGADLFIARRYLISKKSKNVINIISAISLAGVTIATMGLIIVLSVFNGFSDLVVSLYDSFDPQLRIIPAEGKSFEPGKDVVENLKKINGVEVISFTLEEDALIRYGDKQFIATIKGVDGNFHFINNIQDHIVDGEYLLSSGDQDYAVLGSMVAYSLGISLDDPIAQLSIYVPRKEGTYNPIDPSSAFNNLLIRPSSVFAIQQDFDSKYVLVPLDFAREMIGQEVNVSAIELKLAEDADQDEVINEIRNAAGPQLLVQDRSMQHAFLYRILDSEKWAVFFILIFILIIAIFNIIGSLNMLIIEKKKDVAVLRSLGATHDFVRRIFIYEGSMIVFSGAVIGIILGFIICMLQQQFGIIKLDNAESFIIDTYPVAMQMNDFLNVLISVMVIGFAASLYSARSLVDRDTVKLS